VSVVKNENKIIKNKKHVDNVLENRKKINTIKEQK
jgi:hypothetical protein